MLSCSDMAILSGFVSTDSLTACAVSYSESLKGNTKTGAGLKIQNTCTHFQCWLCGVVLSIFLHLKHFAASDLSSLGCSHVVSLFNHEEQRKVGSWCHKHCCHTFWPYSWWQKQTSRQAKRQHSWLCSRNSNKCWFWTNKTERLGFSTEKQMCVHNFF